MKKIISINPLKLIFPVPTDRLENLKSSIENFLNYAKTTNLDLFNLRTADEILENILGTNLCIKKTNHGKNITLANKDLITFGKIQTEAMIAARKLLNDFIATQDKLRIFTKKLAP